MADADKSVVAQTGIGHLWRSLQRTSLSLRLAVLSAALAALVTFGTFAALSVQVRNSTRELFANELARNGRTLVALQRESRRHLVLTASLLADSPSLLSAISTYRVEQQGGIRQRPDLSVTVQRELERLGSDLPGGTLLATDERGRVFAGYARGVAESLAGMDLSALPAVRHALDPALVTTADEPYLSGLEIENAYYGVGAAPLILDGYTIGTIVFGEPVDSTVVARLRREFAGDVVISAGLRIISATLPTSLATEAAHATGNTNAALKLGSEEYLVAVVPLGETQRRTPLRITLLQPLTATVQQLTQALVRDFLLYGTLAVILAGLGAAALSRSLLRPLIGFIRFMRRGAERERVDEEFETNEASQEIRVLNASFNHLMSALSGKRAELEQRSAQLSAANEVLTDEIVERERVETALRESESQLRQSQKLEAIGTLAGGVAHDFNNMLTVITGFTQLAVEQLDKTHPVIDDLKQVQDAARSAASLTHQLLAFSRKQVLQPRVLDLETVVHGMGSMLRRLIGTQVQLDVEHEGEAVRVKADPGQLEQVLLNLAVNARDAMPNGGRLTVTTGRDIRDGKDCALLRVRDTGVGMPAEVQDRIFEPFFTTKAVGKGTGLGLSTVYGIVVQSGGSIEVESEPGIGTAFTVRFPTIAEPAAMPHHDAADDVLTRGTETILLVDDEEAVLALSTRALESCGYRVLPARSGVEALARARDTLHIDALVTDIVMPQMSGLQLVERYLAKYPEPAVVYVTGHVDDQTTRLELDETVFLLRKPFGPAELARTVRAALDARRAPVVVHAN